MIIVSEESLLQATKAAFLALYSGSPNRSDPSVLREDAAIVSVTSAKNDDQPFSLKDGELRYRGQYSKYFPFLNDDIVPLEEKYFAKAFVETNELDAVSDLLLKQRSSRRALINAWRPNHRTTAKGGAACITQLYFRLRNDSLHVHSHSRANDAYRLLLLDMQFVAWAQQEIARRLKVATGELLHFVDSLHLYVKHADEVDKQRQFIIGAQEWRSPGFRL